jgi:hypothetical protein
MCETGLAMAAVGFLIGLAVGYVTGLRKGRNEMPF